MMLRTVGARTSEPTFKHAQVTDLLDVEMFPAMRRAALTLAGHLKAEQHLGATADSIVVRLDDSGSSGLIHELDETLVIDRTHEIVVHG
jgi:hypothetical protein